MRETEEIRKGLLNMLSEDSTIFQAIVIEVNEEEFTCTVMEDEIVTYYDVRLRSVINPEPNGIAMIPKTGSYVLVGRIGKSNELFVCLFSEIDKVIFCNEKIYSKLDNEMVNVEMNGNTINITETGIAIENTENNINCKLGNSQMELNVNDNTIHIEDSTITFNGGKNGGLAKVNELTKKLNELISAFNDHTHSTSTFDAILNGVGDPPALDFSGSTAESTSPNNPFNKFSPSDYSNPHIKH